MGHVRTCAGAGGDFVGDDHGGAAGGVVGAEVHAAEHMGKAVEDGAVPLAVAAEEGHGIGAVLLLDLIELPGDGLIGLVPADGLELALAPLAHPAQGG